MPGGGDEGGRAGILFELWRQDDNGNRFLVATFASRNQARLRLEALCRGGHKQTYWIEEKQNREERG